MSNTALPVDAVPELPLGDRLLGNGRLGNSLLGDERLARLAGRGSERAFAALYERHHQAVYRYCRSILRHEYDAQDALQSTMTRAYAALRAQERELAVKPWLFRIAHNESISILRRRRPVQELVDEHEQPGSEIDSALERRERLSMLVSDLQALPERQRAALLMRELSGLSIQEIAATLGISPGATKQTLFEARSSLHELSQGRAMQCESVMQAISQRDGRVLRSRRMRAHLRACAECRAFRMAIGARRADLPAIAPPLPMSIAGGLLAHLLAQGAAHTGNTVAVSSGPVAATAAPTAGSGAIGSGAIAGPGVVAGAGPVTGAGGVTSAGVSLGGHAAASLVVKGLASVAVVAAAAAGTVHLIAPSAHPDRAGRHAGSSISGAGASVSQGHQRTEGAFGPDERRAASRGAPIAGARSGTALGQGRRIPSNTRHTTPSTWHTTPPHAGSSSRSGDGRSAYSPGKSPATARSHGAGSGHGKARGGPALAPTNSRASHSAQPHGAKRQRPTGHPRGTHASGHTGHARHQPASHHSNHQRPAPAPHASKDTSGAPQSKGQTPAPQGKTGEAQTSAKARSHPEGNR